jgi:hypothetical protein
MKIGIDIWGRNRLYLRPSLESGGFQSLRTYRWIKLHFPQADQKAWMSLKKRRKTHQKLLDLLLRHRLMNRLKLHRIFRRIIVSRKMLIGDVQLMPPCISLHGILLRKPIDHGHRLLLVGNRNAFYFFCHVMNAANPGPKKARQPFLP